MNLKLPAVASLLLVSASLPAAEPFFFVQLADPQLGMFTDNKDFAQETANLELAVATINWLRPAFVVVSGDMLNRPGDAAQTREYQRIMSRVAVNIPMYPVVGNHDIGNAPSPADIATYTNHFGPDHYTFQRAGFVGIVLNSVIIHPPRQERACSGGFIPNHIPNQRSRGNECGLPCPGQFLSCRACS